MEAFASLWDRLAERRIDTGDRHLSSFSHEMAVDHSSS